MEAAPCTQMISGLDEELTVSSTESRTSERPHPDKFFINAMSRSIVRCPNSLSDGATGIECLRVAVAQFEDMESAQLSRCR